MSRLDLLKQASTKIMLAKILDVNPSFLTHTLYVTPIESQYKTFPIPKRSGGDRIISAPSAELKDLQSRLSKLLLDCIDEINTKKNITPKLSHGFVRKKSIITNAYNHINKRNVMNIDLMDFFDSFNFGRVRGFFIKNENFCLNEDIATVIAKIACFNNTLPQGSPCSPVITNLITHSLDIRLAKLAKKHSCTYTRYADDITISTRKKEFPTKIVINNVNEFSVGASIQREITRAGFSINNKKTRVQFLDSRQDVTGLVVNKKVNIKSEYWRTTRAMCHSLFTTGSYFKIDGDEKKNGNIHELDGRLNFIDYIDRYNNTKSKGPIDNRYVHKNHGLNYRAKLNVREKTFSKFLYYKYFIGNQKPTILCEGKTDNIYLKAAILSLSEKYPTIAKTPTKSTPYELLVDFIEYSKRTRYLLDLYGGGSHLKRFVERYNTELLNYEKKKPAQPVILIIDNDKGSNDVINFLVSQNPVHLNLPKDNDTAKLTLKNADFIYVTHNLYIILTPMINNQDSFMENFFDHKTLSIKVDKRSFSPSQDGDSKKTYGKNTFATKVVIPKKKDISFTGFECILDKVVRILHHYNSTAINFSTKTKKT